MPEIDSAKLKRAQKEEVAEKRVEPEGVRVSAGTIDKVIDLAFNPTREKIREVTIIDRVQGRFFPLLDVINAEQRYILEVASFRQDHKEYERVFEKKCPIPPNWLEEYLYRTAQWQKSVLGKNLEKATDIALAEVETKVQEEEGDEFKPDTFFKD